jgi:hypothetical protein
MTRDEFEHVIRAAADATGEDDFVVIGSQAILGYLPDAPPALLLSQEVDLYPRADPAKAVEVDGALGEGSMFHDTFGYYAHGVGPETAKAPTGWEERLVAVAVTNPATGQRAWARCLEINDLALAKCVAGRERDLAYVRTLIEKQLADPAALLKLVSELPIDARQRDRVEKALRGLVAQHDRRAAPRPGSTRG